MKRRSILLVAAVMVLSLTACGTTNTDTKVDSMDSQTQVTDIQQDEAQSAAEEASQVEADSQSETDSQPKTDSEDEKIYDAYINGIGFDIGSTVGVAVLCQTDLDVESLCPCVVVKKEGESDAEKISSGLSGIDWDYETPYIYSEKDNMVDGEGYHSIWVSMGSYGEEFDFTEPKVILNFVVTVNEPGNYTISVESGNGEPTREEEFAQFKDAYSIQLAVE